MYIHCIMEVTMPIYREIPINKACRSVPFSIHAAVQASQSDRGENKYYCCSQTVDVVAH